MKNREVYTPQEVDLIVDRVAYLFGTAMKLRDSQLKKGSPELHTLERAIIEYRRDIPRDVRKNLKISFDFGNAQARMNKLY